ncbi:hypothetical protein NKH77_08360 [Streptomyces sp. M19]
MTTTPTRRPATHQENGMASVPVHIPAPSPSTATSTAPPAARRRRGRGGFLRPVPAVPAA